MSNMTSSRHWSRDIPDDVDEIVFIDFDDNLNFLQKLEHRNLTTNVYYILFTSRYVELESLSDKRSDKLHRKIALQILRLQQLDQLHVIVYPQAQGRKAKSHAVSVPIVVEMTKIMTLNFKMSVMCNQKVIYAAQHCFNRMCGKNIEVIGDRPTFKNFDEDGYYISNSDPSSSNENFRVTCISFIDENNVKLRRSGYDEPHDHFSLYFMNENKNRLSNGSSRNAIEITVPKIDDCADIAIIISMAYFDDILPKDIKFEVRSQDKIFTATNYLSTNYGREIVLPDIEIIENYSTSSKKNDVKLSCHTTLKERGGAYTPCPCSTQCRRRVSRSQNGPIEEEKDYKCTAKNTIMEFENGDDCHVSAQRFQ